MSGNLVTYSDSLNTALDNSKSVHTQLGSIVDLVEGFPTSLDSRIVEYYATYFDMIHATKNKIETDETNCVNFINWLETAITDLQATIDEVNNDEISINSGDNEFSNTNPSGSDADEISINSGDNEFNNTNPSGSDADEISINSGDNEFSNTNPSGSDADEISINSGDNEFNNTNPSGSDANGISINSGDNEFNNTKPNGNGANGIGINSGDNEFNNTKPDGNGANGIGINSGDGDFNNTNPNDAEDIQINIDELDEEMDDLNPEEGIANPLGAGVLGTLFGGLILNQSGSSNTNNNQSGNGELAGISASGGDVDSTDMSGLNGGMMGVSAGGGSANSLGTENLENYGEKITLEQSDASRTDLGTVKGSFSQILQDLTGDPDITLEDLINMVLNPFSGPSDADIFLEHTYIDNDVWNSLPKEVQDAILAKLEEVGYTKEEIAKILSGDIGVVSVVQNKVSDALEKLYAENPEIREILREIYGFDIFHEDGTIDPSKLALLLLIDQKNGLDSYSLITLLHDQYGIELISDEEIGKISELLMDLVKDNPFLRALLIKKYGFDIFNPDGTINYEKLVMALLMDSVSLEDSFDLYAFIEMCKKYHKFVSFLGTIFKILLSSKLGLAMSGILGCGLIVGLGGFLSNALKDTGDGIWGGFFKKEKYYFITKEAYEAFSLTDKEMIQTKMKQVGYRDEDIKCLENGEVAVLKEPLDDLYARLGKLMKDDEDLEDEIESIYHFELRVGNRIDLDKLATILVIDYKKSLDEYDICKIIHKTCGAIISIDSFADELVRITEIASKIDENLKTKLEEEYQTEIMNEEGEVNKNQLLELLRENN